MYEGGAIDKPRSSQVFRFAGLFVPSILIIYGVLIQPEAIKTNVFLTNSNLLIFSFLWLFLGVLQFLFPAVSKIDSTLRIIAYHLLASSYLIFVSGFNTPLIAFWLLLIMAAYMYFNRNGFALSLALLILTSIADIILQEKFDYSIIMNNFMTLVVVITTGIVFFSVAQDQTVSKLTLSKLNLQRDRVMTIINNLADAVISTDTEGFIRIYNAASLGLLDTNVSLSGRHIDEILPLIDQAKNKVSLFDEFKKNKIVSKRDDLDYIISQDDSIRLEITFSPVRSRYSRTKKSEINNGYVLIMRDVTKAKSLDEERDEFISVISHELRTPLTIAEGTLSNVQLMMKHPDVTNPMLSDSINTAHKQILFLSSMVNDLSNLSRAERGVSDDVEEIDVRELAHGLINKYQQDAKAKKLQLNLDLSAKLDNIVTSRLYLEELLQNFITNAIKYTKKGSVTLGISQKGKDITFSVKDTGIGISKSDQQKVFNEFYRSEDYRTRETGGTGLGLYIASKLARKLNTKIMLTSRLNFGSNFSFSISTKTKD